MIRIICETDKEKEEVNNFLEENCCGYCDKIMNYHCKDCNNLNNFLERYQIKIFTNEDKRKEEKDMDDKNRKIYLVSLCESEDLDDSYYLSLTKDQVNLLEWLNEKGFDISYKQLTDLSPEII